MTARRATSSRSTSPAASGLADALAAATEVAEYRRINAQLAGQLARERARTQMLVAATYDAVRTATSALTIPPVMRLPQRKAKASGRTPETAIIAVSDLQLGKVTPTYSTAVCEERMARYARKIARLTDVQRSDHPVRSARVYLLGDIVEGEMIFPHQAHQLDSSLFRQVTVDGPRIVAAFLRNMLALFDDVHVVGVIGNHGRLGPYRSPYNPESNADRMLYEIVRQLMEREKRLTWFLPYHRNEAEGMAVDYPCGGRGNGVLLFHGDQIPNSSSASTATIARRIWGWANGAVDQPFRYAIWGHHHSSKRFRFNKQVGWCNGSTESTNTYARDRFSATGEPEQTLLFMHPKHGVTAENQVALSVDD